MSELSEEEIIEEVEKELKLAKNIDDVATTIRNEYIEGLLDLYKQEKEMYKNTGKIVRNKRDGKVGVVLREFETGQIQVLEKIGDKGGKVINTHDSWKTLEVIEDE